VDGVRAKAGASVAKAVVNAASVKNAVSALSALSVVSVVSVKSAPTAIPGVNGPRPQRACPHSMPPHKTSTAWKPVQQCHLVRRRAPSALRASVANVGDVIAMDAIAVSAVRARAAPPICSVQPIQDRWTPARQRLRR